MEDTERDTSRLTSVGDARNAETAAGLLLELAQELALELHSYRRHRARRATLASSLQRDFGFDSLARVELWARVERAFGLRLPEELLGEAETLGDLLSAVLAPSDQRAVRPVPRLELEGLELVERAPERASTLVEALDWHVQAHPERPHLILPGGTNAEQVVTYSALYRGAKKVAAGLRARDIGPGAAVAIMLPTGLSFFEAFFGALLAGGVPVPIYPPFRMSQIEEHLRRQVRILSNAVASILITFPEARNVGGLLRSLVDSIRTVETVDELGASAAAPWHPSRRGAADTALLQYTSGSTGQPKGVVLSHANLLANLRAMGERLDVSSKDIFVSWLPLYHDMGLIGVWLGSLYYAIPAVILSPLQFLASPQCWLWAIHDHRGTLSASPNFGYELCVRRIADDDIEGLDLSSWRFAANGSEPVSAATIGRFADRFAPYGLRRDAIAPVYGLAESSVGLTFPPPGRPPVIDRVEREALTRRGEAVPSSAGDGGVVEVVACGQPLPGHEVRIVDATGRELGERHEGRLQFRGPSVTAGYFRGERDPRSVRRRMARVR